MNRWLVVLAAVLVCSKGSFIPSGRIFGGHDTEIEEVPWQVSLMFYGTHFCGGTIINKNTVVTAAHCLYDTQPSEIMIRGGSKIQWKGGFAGHIKKIVMHPKFNGTTNFNDIGLIQIEGTFTFSDKLAPASLPKQDAKLPVGKTGVISGWGLLYSDGPCPKLLQSTEIPIIDLKTCKDIHKDRLKDSMFCAGPLEGGRDTCQEDSGGPLVVGQTLVGISSWGVGCGRPMLPGVYTDVAQFTTWIHSIIDK